MELAGTLRVVGRMEMMPVGRMRVMGGLLDIIVAMMMRGLAMMFGRLLVMRCRLFVVVGKLAARCRHGSCLSVERTRRPPLKAKPAILRSRGDAVTGA